MTDVDAPVAPRDETPTAAPRVDTALSGSLVAALVATGALAATARVGALALLVAVAVVQAALVAAWVLGPGMPGRKGAVVVGAMASAGADVVVSVWPHGRLGALLAVLGLAVPVLFAHQLLRGAARTRLVESMSAVSVLVLAVVALPALLQLRHEFDPREGGVVVSAVAAAAGAALVVGYLVDLVVPAPRFDPAVPRGMAALVVSTAVAAAVGYLMLRGHAGFVGGRSVFVGAAVGAVVALLAVAAAFVLHSAPRPAGRAAPVLRPGCAALLPLCLLAPGAFLLCLAIRI